MRNIWIIAQHEYLKNVKRLGFLLFTFGVPVFMLGFVLLSSFATIDFGQLFGRMLIPDGADQPVGFVDQSGRFTPLMPGYEADFQLYDTPDAGREALRGEEIRALLVVPESYSAADEEIQLIVREGASITETTPERSLLEPFFTEHLLRGENVSDDVRGLLADPYDLDRVSLGDGGGDSLGGAAQQVADSIVPYFAGILLVMTIFLTSGYLLQGVSNEKTSRIVEILLSSVSSRDLLAGKVFGLAALGLTQIAIWIGSVLLIGYGLSARAGIADIIASAFLNRPDFLLLATVYYLLGFLVYAALYGAAGAVGTSQQESQQLAGAFSFIAASPLFIAGLLFANPNGIIPRVLSFFPLTSPTMMLIRLPLAEVPTVDIVGSIVVLTITIPVMIWVGARLFRLGLLMYSQRPTFRQMWRALRQS